ncbi:Gfo/Idh/MocA family protein [Gorillibacterium timonense]|uniref:Gfo/Idh/MocA family protein n=1 Tax=Gorillibacterium timonense TaxID=1689269 RepID=UPI00071E42C3|nr:Gfo/Idh/MocA family oxidoreductase [Gorillibacterium timonense]
MTKRRIAVIGLGDIAQKAYLPVLSRHPKIEIVSVMSRRQETVDRIRAEYRFPAGGTDLGQLLEAEPEAVFIHAPTEAHTELVLGCLRRGLHVYVDKPLSYDIRESRAMAEEALARGLLLAVGFNRRFAPFYQQARNHVRDAGGIEYAVAEKHRIRQQKHDAKRTLYDDLIHMLDLLVWLAGEEPAVVGKSLRIDSEGRLLHASGGVESGRFTAQFAMNRAAGSDLERLSLYGSGHTAEIVNLEQGILSSVTSGERSIRFGSWDSVLERRGFVGVIDHFLKSLDKPEGCEIRADLTLPTHRLVEKLL